MQSECPIWKTLLLGINDEGSALAALKPFRSSLLLSIYSMVSRFYLERISTTRLIEDNFPYGPENHYTACVSISRLGSNTGHEVEFPAPRGICINMMPFYIGDRDSIPPEYQHYWPLIEQCTLGGYNYCLDIPQSKHHRDPHSVFYLTIDERVLEAGQVHRRPGLHIEAPGLIRWKGDVPLKTQWGYGFWSNGPVGGIWMASNVAESTGYYDVEILEHDKVVQPGGGCQHIRHFLDKVSNQHSYGRYRKMEANQIYWMHDRTPHECLPVVHACSRQFFRLVASDVSVWYEEHSTANRLGIQPNAEIIKGSKFKHKNN